MYIGITTDGKISICGTPPKHIRGNVYLDQYDLIVVKIPDGQLRYYPKDHDDPYYRGKLSDVGNSMIFYRDRLEHPEAIRGKVAIIGDIHFVYYESSLDHSYEFGKIKRVGDVSITYDTNGRIKTIG